MPTIAEQWREEGREEGREAGRAEGKASLLLRLIERRFGPAPFTVRERHFAAQPTQLDQWGERLLDAGDLRDVFES